MNTATTFRYFAYGSNLKLSEIQGTCSTAVGLFPALLPDYALVFPRKSKRRKCGVASIERRPGEIVWGEVYSISETQRASLEEREDFIPGRPLPRNSYFRKNLTVFGNGDSSKPFEVTTFIANPQEDAPLPSKKYMELIIGGATEWNLDTKYIAGLRSIRTG